MMSADTTKKKAIPPRKEFPNAVDVLKLPGSGRVAKATSGESLNAIIEQNEKLAVKKVQLAQVDRIAEEERAATAKLKKDTDELERGKTPPRSEAREKYSVDPATGDIRVATADEPNALSMSEAEALSSKTKTGIEARKKSEKDTKEGPFTLGPSGEIVIKEGASMTSQDLAVLQAVNKAQEGGDRRSSMEILKEKRDEFITMQEWTGGNRNQGGFSDFVDTFTKIKDAFGMDAETKAVFTAIKDKLDNIGKGTGETEEVKGLREQVNKLSEAIQQKEKEVLQGQISALNNQLNTMEARLEKKLAEAETKDEFSIMHTALKGAIDELKGVRGDLVTIFKAPPSPLSSGEKKKITQGISEDAQKEAALQTLEEQTFFG
jgi:hypothetical protein